MKKQAPIEPPPYDQVTTDPDGYRDKRGEWRPAQAVAFAPIFVWPVRALQFLRWLGSYLFSWNILFFAITLGTWLYAQPSLERCRTFQLSWVAQMFIRNLILLWIIYGSWHLYLYAYKLRGYRGKYSPRWQSTSGATFLFRNQVHDNIFWSCGSGCITWTAYEVVTMWMYANQHLPYLDYRTSPVLFAGWFLLIPVWREFHFYWIHRLIHWKPLYDKIHYLHHYNINPGPWSGLAMHPIEHLLYFSVTLIHWIIPSHPLHFLFNAQHTALTPAAGHTGFEGKLGDQVSFGSYFHYLHHRHFDCNFGESTIPFDKWFGSFEDGSRTDSEKSESKRNYQTYVIDRVVDECPTVKSFYLKRDDGGELDPYAPGQHLLFKIPDDESGTTSLRFYTLSDCGGADTYRISVKRESPPPHLPNVPPGRVSTYLHDRLAAGGRLEARGPLGDFTPALRSLGPLALVAGGIGITPILAMAKGCLRQRPRRPIHLFLAFRDPAHQVFKEEVDALLRAHPRVTCHVLFDAVDPGEIAGLPGAYPGRIDAGFLKENLPTLSMPYYICGPGPMMTGLTEGLVEAGVDRATIHTESFTQEANPAGSGPDTHPQVEVTFSRSKKTLLWDSEFRSLLEFAEANGVVMEAGCLFGECGACSTRVEEGDVDYNYTTAIKPSAGHCLPCSCRPRSPLTLDA